MKTSRWRIAGTACALALAGHLGAATTSEVLLHVNPSVDDYWHVAESNPTDLRWEKPASASSAELEKTMSGRTIVLSGLTEDSVSLGTGGSVQAPADERVAELKLTFDDPAETTQRASIAFLADVAEVRNPNGAEWNRLKGSALLPVPASATALTVDGVAVPSEKFDGTGGWWYFAGRDDGAPVTLCLTAGGEQYATSVFCRGCGLLFMVR